MPSPERKVARLQASSGQYSFSRLLNSDWSIQISRAPAACKNCRRGEFALIIMPVRWPLRWNCTDNTSEASLRGKFCADHVYAPCLCGKFLLIKPVWSACGNFVLLVPLGLACGYISTDDTCAVCRWRLCFNDACVACFASKCACLSMVV